MSSSHEAIKRVIEAFERSDWAEIDVRVGDLRVHLSTAAPGGSGSATSAGAAPAAPSDSPRSVGDEAARDPALIGEGRSSSADAPPSGAHLVISPSPGIFWRSPEPGLPPFTEEGETVDASATVCIVEVMKLMNHVKAGVRGEVVAVYGQNGVAVQKGEPLFAIVPKKAES